MNLNKKIYDWIKKDNNYNDLQLILVIIFIYCLYLGLFLMSVYNILYLILIVVQTIGLSLIFKAIFLIRKKAFLTHYKYHPKHIFNVSEVPSLKIGKDDYYIKQKIKEEFLKKR